MVLTSHLVKTREAKTIIYLIFNNHTFTLFSVMIANPLHRQSDFILKKEKKKCCYRKQCKKATALERL